MSTDHVNSLVNTQAEFPYKLEIVLQGKYSEWAYDTALEYLKLPFVDKVIMACMQDDELPYWREVTKNSQIVFLQTDFPPSPGTGNRNLQIVTSLKGLQHVTTEYSIKMRNDQRYDYDSMITMYKFWLENKKRKTFFDGQPFGSMPRSRVFVAGNFYAFPFHPRDHIFWGNTQDLIDIFDIPLEPLAIEERINMSNTNYSMYYDCYIRTEAYIGAHYCSEFDYRIKKWLLKPDKYLYDDAPNYQVALELSNELTRKVFKSFPREGIDLTWNKYGYERYPYDNQYNVFHERWHEDGY